MPILSRHQSITSPSPWNLTIDSTVVVVTDSMSIGAVMVQLVNHIDTSEDFSDHALWWPKSNTWLTNLKWTLSQYGIQSDAHLTFTSMHKFIRLQLPDLRILSIRIDFSVSVFLTVCKLCQELGFRHAEELSLSRLPKVLNNSIGDTLPNNTSTLFSPTKDLSSENLAQTPLTSIKNLLPQLTRPINLIEKCKLNNLWFDSSKSLMEQTIIENDLILLRFKYYSFYDLNPKLDSIRINQLYEQAKWSLLSEDIDCTEEEMMTFAALQLQIQIQSSTKVISQEDNINHNVDQSTKSRIQSKEGLRNYLHLIKPRRFTFKSFKRYWFVLRGTQLTYYTNESQQHSTPIEKLSLKGGEILPDVNISAKKFSIRLMIPSIDGMNETLIKCSTEEQYATWMAAFRLASKGQSTDETSYETERESILMLLNMQIPQQTKFDIQTENYVSRKFSKKYKTKQLTERILEAHAAVSNLDGAEAKLRYLKVWQSLPEFGITTFIVKFQHSDKKEELFAIASNRLLRMTMTGNMLKTWWTSRMRSWNVNWENKLVTIEFDSEKIHFFPLYGIDSKCIHEFIGAYIFLAMRSTMSDNNDLLRQETLFQQLTAAYS